MMSAVSSNADQFLFKGYNGYVKAPLEYILAIV